MQGKIVIHVYTKIIARVTFFFAFFIPLPPLDCFFPLTDTPLIPSSASKKMINFSINNNNNNRTFFNESGIIIR